LSLSPVSHDIAGPQEKLLEYIQSWSLGKGLFTENEEFGLREGEDAFAVAGGGAGAADDSQ
jgi:hypothetical protein